MELRRRDDARISTERDCSTFAPDAASSSISSRTDRVEPAGVRHDPRVGREHRRRRPCRSRRRRRRAAPAIATAVRSDAPRPSVVISCRVETPWKPASTTTLPRLERLDDPLRPDLDDLGLAVLGVGDDAGLRTGVAGGRQPRALMAMPSSDIAIRSPAVSSMSISRGSGTAAISSAIAARSSVVSPIAETTTMTSSPPSRARTTRSATA